MAANALLVAAMQARSTKPFSQMMHEKEKNDKEKEKSREKMNSMRPSQHRVNLDVDFVIEHNSRETGLDPPKSRQLQLTREKDLRDWVDHVLQHPSGAQTERGSRRDEAVSLASGSIGNSGTAAVNSQNGSQTARGKDKSHTETVLTKTEWAKLLYRGPPKLPKALSRPLEKTSTEKSYIPVLRENNAQRDQENRANIMIRNSGDARHLIRRRKLLGTATSSGITDDDADAAAKYDDEQESKGSMATLETFLKISSEKLDVIKQTFISNGGSLDVSKFVAVLYENMPHGGDYQQQQDDEDRSRLVGELFDLFSQIDVIGEERVSWEQLLSYMIECERLSGKVNIGSESILSYHPSHIIDKEVRGTDVVIEKVLYFPELDLIGVCERGSRHLKLYQGDDLTFVTSIMGHNGQILTALHISELDYLVTSASDGCLMFWGAYTMNLRERIPVGVAQMALAWDPKHQHMYSSAAQTGDITVWSMERMSPVRVLRGHTDSVPELLIVHSMDSLFSASLDFTIKIWDLGNGSNRGTLRGHKKGVYALAFIPGQRYIVSAGFDHEVKVWNPLIDKVLYHLPHSDSIVGLINVRGTPRLLSASSDGVMKMWDTRTFLPVQEISPMYEREGETGGLFCTGFIPIRDRVMLGGKKLWLLDYQQPVEPTLADENPVVAARFMESTCSIITAAGKSVKVWDGYTGRLISAFNDLTTSDITAMVVDGRERKIVLGETNGSVRVYNARNGALMKALEPHQSDVSALAYCSLTKCVITAGWDRYVKVQHDSDVDRLSLLRSMKGHANDITCMVYSLELALIASGSSDGYVRIWDYEEAKLEGSCTGHRTEITALLFVDKLRILVSCDFVGAICVWLVRPWNQKCCLVCRIDNVCPIAENKVVAAMSLDYNSDDNQLICGNENGSVTVYDARGLVHGLDRHHIPQARKRETSKHSRHGRLVVPVPPGAPSAQLTGADLASGLRHLRFVDPPNNMSGAFTLSRSSLKYMTSWMAHNDSIRSLQYIPNPKSILTSSFDCRVCFWSTTGVKYGELHQGVDVMGKGWKLDIDAEARKLDEQTIQANRDSILKAQLEENAMTILPPIHDTSNTFITSSVTFMN